MKTPVQQRVSTGRFAALVSNSIVDTDQDDFLPTTQSRHSDVPTKTAKRKLSTPLSTSVSMEQKRPKKSNLFRDVVSVTSLTLSDHRTHPPPPWLDLPTGESL